MKTTSNLGLMKPEGTDVVDIENFNANADTLDTTIGAMSTVPTTAKNIAGAIKEIHTAMSNLDTTISDGEITTAKLADSAVTTVKLAANAVTGAKMANSTVTATQLADGAVTSAKLADSGVSAGTYKSVTVDGKGRVTAGANPTTLSGYGIMDAAPLASPALTGTPTAPTAVVGTNTTQVATTAFVNASTTAAKISPAFTGTPTAPTAAAGTNTTQIATTAFVQNEVSGIVAPLTSIQREVASLKMLSTLKTKVDGASDYFFDDMSSKVSAPLGSSMELDMTQAVITSAMFSGSTSCTALGAADLKVGSEVTIQSISSSTVFERNVIQSISGNTVTFVSTISNTFPVGSLIYRSLVDRGILGTMKFRKMTTVSTPVDFVSSSTVTMSPITADYGTYASTATGNNLLNYVSFSNYGNYMSYNALTTNITILRRFGDSYQTVQTISLPNNYVVAQHKLSSDGMYLYVTHTNTSGPMIMIYKNVGGQFVQLPTTNIVGSVPTTVQGVLELSNSGNYFATIGSTNEICLFRRNGDLFTRLTMPQNPPVNSLAGLAISPDDKYLVWSSIWNPNAAGAYKINGDVVTYLGLLPSISNYPGGQVLFSNDSKKLLFIQSTQNSYMDCRLYNVGNDVFTHYKTLGNDFYGPGFFTTDSNYLILTNNVNQGFHWRTSTTDTSTTPTNIAYSPAMTGNVSRAKTDPTGTVFYHTLLGLFCSPSKISIDVNTADIRYKTKVTTSISGAVAFVERSSIVPVSVTASLSVGSGVENPIGMTAERDETVDSTTLSTTFSKALPAGTSATLRLTMTRTSIMLDPVITKIMGATE